MDLNILKHLPEYGVLLCTICEESYCLPLNGIAEHLRDFHKDVLTKKQRGTLVKYSKTLELLSPKKVLIPQKERGPVPGLHKIHGFECLECNILLGTPESMRKHCGYKHEWTKKKPNIWRRQYIQVDSLDTELIIRVSSLLRNISNISLSTFQKTNKRVRKLPSKHCSNARH